MVNKGKMISRRQFLRADFSSRRSMLRPPWALAEAQFLSQCDGCARCAEACPTHVVSLVNRYPQIDFLSGECTFCKRCAETCPTGALQRPVAEHAPWTIAAQVSNDCLAHEGVMCLVCKEYCDARAISFPPKLGHTAIPVVDAGRCTGCGACVAPCPTRAISMYQAREQFMNQVNPIKEAVCT